MDNSSALRAGSMAAGVAWVSGVAMTVMTKGVDLQATQTVEMKEKLLTIIHSQPQLLLKVMGCDTLFVMGYVVVFAALFLAVPRSGRLVAAIGLAFGLLAGLSDIIENVLYVVYGVGALHGTVVTPELPFHYYISTLKWLAAFTSVGLTVLVFPRRTWLEWGVCAVMASFPLGGALSVAEPGLLPLRALFFVVGMPLFALLFARRAQGLGPVEAFA